jgi:bifunctional UDP-N-acetylglucosamine pyrophosphorylase/glucosamine-1-phosphate N-acetyltransferase
MARNGANGRKPAASTKRSPAKAAPKPAPRSDARTEARKEAKANLKSETRTAAALRKTNDARAPAARAGAAADLACVVLAAGKGTRMRSARAKVLHEILGRPLVVYPVELARSLGAEPVVAVLGHQLAAVEMALGRRFGPGQVRVVEQAQQLGTGHALRTALPALEGFDGVVLVLYGDVPLLRRETLSELVGTARRYRCLSLVTASPPDPGGYGRVVRDSRGHVIRIVEHKDATPEERAIGEVNAGIYAAPADLFREALSLLAPANAQREYYLTDVVAHAASTVGVSTVEADPGDVAGVNDRTQLAEAEATMRRRVNGRWLAHVTFRDPHTTLVEPDVWLGVDVELGRGVALRGATRVGRGARVGDGAILVDSEVGPGAEVPPYTVAAGAVFAAGATRIAGGADRSAPARRAVARPAKKRTPARPARSKSRTVTDP